MSARPGIRKMLVLGLALLCGAHPARALASASIPLAYQRIGQEAGVPPPVLYAAALAASRQRLSDGQTHPWPWTLWVRGRAERFASRAAVEAALRRHGMAGRRPLAVGVLRVAWPAPAPADPAVLLDPYVNLHLGARALRAAYDRCGDWPKAAGHAVAPDDPAQAARVAARVRRGWRAPSARAVLQQRVRALAPAYGLDPALVLAVADAESGFRPDARSPKNAQGVMQLLPATAARFGVRDPWNPEDNLRGGMAYLRWLLAHFQGDVRLTLASYNAGEAAVVRHRGVPPYRETRAYVARILRQYGRLAHPYVLGAAAPAWPGPLVLAER